MGQIVHDDLGDTNAWQACEARGLAGVFLNVWIRDLGGHHGFPNAKSPKSSDTCTMEVA